MKKTAGFLLALYVTCLVLPKSYATEPNTTSRIVYDQKIVVALGLMKRADLLLRQQQTPENLKVVISLYAEAGQLFEQSKTGYAKLAEQGGASEVDVENASRGIRYCINSINELKKHLH